MSICSLHGKFSLPGGRAPGALFPARARTASRLFRPQGKRAANSCMNPMKIALPLNLDSSLSVHFGGAEMAALFEVDPVAGTILSQEEVKPPVASPCAWSGWLREQGVSLVIAGGMGEGARAGLQAAGIAAIAGADTPEPRRLVEQWLRGGLAEGINPCGGDHPHGESSASSPHHHPHSHATGHHGHGSCGCGGH